MKITPDFIQKHKTQNGGWTKRQLEALGMPWPPSKGWIRAAAAKEHDQKSIATFTRKLTEREE